MKKPWNVEQRIKSSAPEDQRRALEVALDEDPYVAAPQVEELEKTEHERQGIECSKSGLARLLERLRLPSIEIPDSRIHVVTDQELSLKIGGELEGKMLFGHIYLARRDPLQFYRNLTHELSHAGSYYGLGVIQGIDPRRLRMWQTHLGLSFQPKPQSERGSEVYFNGLNEGATELCARFLRKHLVKEMPGLEDEQKSDLKSFVHYRPCVILVDRLIRLVAEEEQLFRETVLRELLRDYFSGTQLFLKKVETHKKGSVKILRSMDSTPDDALRAAEALGFDDARRAMLTR
ncbi:MAG: hypothetical protein WC641_05950 [Patescibacteria group bacterium]